MSGRFFDLPERAQQLAMTLSTSGVRDPRNEIAVALDTALTDQPNRPWGDVIVDVLRDKGARCGVRDDGFGRLTHRHDGDWDCADDLEQHLTRTLIYHAEKRTCTRCGHEVHLEGRHWSDAQERVCIDQQPHVVEGETG